MTEKGEKGLPALHTEEVYRAGVKVVIARLEKQRVYEVLL
jgi:hypothetical protein